jgi:hypothetical protein
MPIRQAAPCLRCCAIIEPSQIAFVADIRLRAVGMEDAPRSPQASVSICVTCSEMMAKGDEPPENKRPLDHIVYELLRDMIANDFTFSLHSWIAMRKEQGLPVPVLVDPKVIKAWKEFQRTLALPAIQTIDSPDGGEGKLMRVG